MFVAEPAYSGFGEQCGGNFGMDPGIAERIANSVSGGLTSLAGLSSHVPGILAAGNLPGFDNDLVDDGEAGNGGFGEGRRRVWAVPQ
jgi:hypothetical protein